MTRKVTAKRARNATPLDDAVLDTATGGAQYAAATPPAQDSFYGRGVLKSTDSGRT